jgi:hypothetical protein
MSKLLKLIKHMFTFYETGIIDRVYMDKNKIVTGFTTITPKESAIRKLFYEDKRKTMTGIPWKWEVKG